MKRIFGILIVFLIAVILTYIFQVGEKSLSEEYEIISKADTSMEYIYDNNPNWTKVNYDSPALLHPCDDLGQDYIDSLVFYCDSPTYWLKGYGLLSEGTESTQIWVTEENTTTFVYYEKQIIVDPYYHYSSMNIISMVEEYKPEKLVVAVGINGMALVSKDDFYDIYTQMIEDIIFASPDTQIILQSIYPINRNYKNWGSIFNNAEITYRNAQILKIAEEHNLKYSDTFSALIDEDGYAKSELMKNDGLHPNEEGLKVILEYLRTHGIS